LSESGASKVRLSSCRSSNARLLPPPPRSMRRADLPLHERVCHDCQQRAPWCVVRRACVVQTSTAAASASLCARRQQQQRQQRHHQRRRERRAQQRMPRQSMADHAACAAARARPAVRHVQRRVCGVLTVAARRTLESERKHKLLDALSSAPASSIPQLIEICSSYMLVQERRADRYW
jgi:flagellum-specific peptidoglycan hydrolase FlgJ